MTYTKTYYRLHKQKEFADIEKVEKVECTELHEDEYYIWNEGDNCYHEAVIEYWI